MICCSRFIILTVFIGNLIVFEKFRGKGFGTKLVKKIILYCHKNNILMIYVSAGIILKIGHLNFMNI
ncbi:GNAT family N-acetyltransferase [archaeon]|nr:GNAT family N-acetyltransferase [archaeon]